jgi:VCBS repeat-containing protein
MDQTGFRNASSTGAGVAFNQGAEGTWSFLTHDGTASTAVSLGTRDYGWHTIEVARRPQSTLRFRRSSEGDLSTIPTGQLKVLVSGFRGMHGSSTLRDWFLVREYNDPEPTAQIVDPNQPPVAPMNVQAAVQSRSEVLLTWTDASVNETGFEIHRGIDAENYELSGSMAADATGALINGLQPSTTYYFVVRATNSVGYGESAAVTATTAANFPPSAQADAYSLDEDIPLTVPAPGVLENDIDPEGDVLSAVMVSSPAHGAVTFNEDGSFIYSPDANYNGMDSFTYQASDEYAESATTTVTLNVALSNDLPLANPDTVAAQSGLAVRVNVLANDTDPDGESLTVVAVTQGTDGTVTINPDNTLSYRSEPGFTGEDMFTYTVTDGTATVVGTVTVSVEALQPPAAPTNVQAAVQSRTEVLLTWTDASENETGFQVLRGVDGEHYALSASAPADATNALVNGLQPSTTYYFVVRATNSAGYNSSSAVTASTPGDFAPSAQADSYALDEDTLLTVAAPGVLENDIDPEGDLISAVLVSGPSHGTLSLNTNGAFTYGPDANYHGADSFTYQASDGYAESAATAVTLNIAPSNDLPVANADTVTVQAGGAVAIDVLANDTDADGESLSIADVTQGTHGSVSINPDNTLTYQSEDSFTGQDMFTYVLTDGAATGVGTVTVDVQALQPPATPINLQAAVQSRTEVLLTWTDASANETGFEIYHGVDGQDYELSGSAAADATSALVTGLQPSTTYYFVVRATNSAGYHQSTPVVATTAANLAPGAQADAYVLEEDTPLSVDAPGALENDTDAEGDRLLAVLVSGPDHGVLTLNANGSFVYSPTPNYNGIDSFAYRASDGYADSAPATVTLNVAPSNDLPKANGDAAAVQAGVAVSIDVLANDTDVDGETLTIVEVTQGTHGTVTINSDNTLTYQSQAGFTGEDVFTYSATDGSATVVGTVTVDVQALQPPAAPINLQAAVQSRTEVLLTWTDVSANESGFEIYGGVDGQNYERFSSTEANATSALVAGLQPSTTYYFVVHATNVAGYAQSAAIMATTATNRAPGAQVDSYALAEDTPLVVGAPGVLANDIDPDADVLSAVLMSGPAHGVVTLNINGSFSYTPISNYHGIDSFTYDASDGYAVSASTIVTLNVAAANDPPVANPDTASTEHAISVRIDVLANDTDAEGDTLALVGVAQGVGGAITINPDHTLTYEPEADFAGEDLFTYSVTDGASTVVGTVTVTVAPLQPPAAPMNVQAAAQSRMEVLVTWTDASANETGFGVYKALDGDNYELAGSAVADATSALVAGLQPSTTYYFVVRAFNPAGYNESSATTATTLANAAPNAQANSYQLNEDTTLTVNAPGLLGNDTDPEGDVLSALLATGPAHGTLSLNANGSLTYNPNANYNGVDSFTYRASDGYAESATTTVTLNVVPSNDPPVANPDAVAVQAGVAVSIDVLANDTDADGDPLTIMAVTQGTGGTVTINSDDTLSYQSNAGFTGQDVFTYSVSDGAAAVVGTVTVNVGENLLFADNFETGSFAAGGWTVSGSSSVDPAAAQVGNYGALLKRTAAISKRISSINATTVQLSYGRRTSSLESGEAGWVEVSPNAQDWTTVETVSGAKPWESKTFEISLSGSTLYLRFRLNGDEANDTFMVDEVKVTGGTPIVGDKMHIGSILVQTKDAGKNLKRGYAEVVVLDGNDEPVAGADVTGTFSGSITQALTSTTGADGIAVFQTTSTVSGRVRLNFCVDDVTADDLTYDPTANVETCDKN